MRFKKSVEYRIIHLISREKHIDAWNVTQIYIISDVNYTKITNRGKYLLFLYCYKKFLIFHLCEKNLEVDFNKIIF